MGDKLTLRERHLLLWVFKQKRLHHKQKRKYDALDESAVKGMFERLFFGTYKCLARMEGHTHTVDVSPCMATSSSLVVVITPFVCGMPIRTSTWLPWKGILASVSCLTLYGNKLFYCW